jgi:hypothetical protein
MLGELQSSEGFEALRLMLSCHKGRSLTFIIQNPHPGHGEIAIFTGLPKPYHHTRRLLVYCHHLANLYASFSQVGLIDTDSVRPYVSVSIRKS